MEEDGIDFLSVAIGVLLASIFWFIILVIDSTDEYEPEVQVQAPIGLIADEATRRQMWFDKCLEFKKRTEAISGASNGVLTMCIEFYPKGN